MRGVAIVALVLGIGLMGCGSSSKTKTKTSTSQPAASGAGAVQVSESEFKFNPANVAVKKSGSVTIKMVNDGTVMHSLEVEGNGVSKRIPGTISPGSSKTLTVSLKPGRYQWYCPVDGHRGLGMRGTITVGGGKAAAGSSTSKGSGSGGGGSTGGGGGSYGY